MMPLLVQTQLEQLGLSEVAQMISDNYSSRSTTIRFPVRRS